MNTQIEKLSNLHWVCKFDAKDEGKIAIQIWKFDFPNMIGQCEDFSLFYGVINESNIVEGNHKVVAYATLGEQERVFAKELYERIKQRDARVKKLEEHFAKMKNEDKYHELAELTRDINEL